MKTINTIKEIKIGENEKIEIFNKLREFIEENFKYIFRSALRSKSEECKGCEESYSGNDSWKNVYIWIDEKTNVSFQRIETFQENSYVDIVIRTEGEPELNFEIEGDYDEYLEGNLEDIHIEQIVKALNISANYAETAVKSRWVLVKR